MRRLLPVFLILIAAVGMSGEPLDQHGKAHKWKGDVERLTVIDFAAAWCVPCWEVLPRLQRFADTHPDIGVIVVSVDDKRQGRDKLVERLGLTVPVLWDENDEIAETYRPEGMPATFVLSTKGEVVYSHVGSAEHDWDEMVAFIEREAKK